MQAQAAEYSGYAGRSSPRPFCGREVQDETWRCLIKLPTAYHPYNLDAVAVGELSGLKIAALYGLTIHFD